MNKKVKKKFKKNNSKSNELTKLKSKYKKGLLKFSSREIADAILEDLGQGIIKTKNRKKH